MQGTKSSACSLPSPVLGTLSILMQLGVLSVRTYLQHFMSMSGTLCHSIYLMALLFWYVLIHKKLNVAYLLLVLQLECLEVTTNNKSNKKLFRSCTCVRTQTFGFLSQNPSLGVIAFPLDFSLGVSSSVSPKSFWASTVSELSTLVHSICMATSRRSQ